MLCYITSHHSKDSAPFTLLLSIISILIITLCEHIAFKRNYTHILCTFLLTERRKEKRKRDTVNFDTDTDKVPYNKHIDQIYPYVFSANQSDCINEETKSTLRNLNVQINSQWVMKL